MVKTNLIGLILIIRFNNEVIEAICNDQHKLESIVIIDNKSGEKKKIYCAGLFYGIGHTPNSDLVKDMIDLKSNKYIKKVDSSTKTNIAGIFAAGDISDDVYRQAITAAASGCIAALDCFKYLESI